MFDTNLSHPTRMFLSIDGACRRNGKPDCVASGGVFIQKYNELGMFISCDALSAHEYSSTNQRGELLALIKALEYIDLNRVHSLILTDSEYIYNAMTKQWYISWINNDWKTREGNDVKNQDLWVKIASVMHACEGHRVDLAFYHVKGHCIPFGKVTASNALKQDPTGYGLSKLVKEKYDAVAPTKVDVFKAAHTLSIKNNGFAPDSYTFREWVVANVMADAIATEAVEAADQWS